MTTPDRAAPRTEAAWYERLAALLHETRQHSGAVCDLCITTAQGFRRQATGEAAAAPALDVERLALALHACEHPAISDCRLGLFMDPPPAWAGRRKCEVDAERLAAEYQRLTPSGDRDPANDAAWVRRIRAMQQHPGYDIANGDLMRGYVEALVTTAANDPAVRAAGDRDRREARLIEVVKALPGVDWEYRDGSHNMVDRDAVLALLAAPGQAGPVIGSKTIFHPDGSSSRYELRAAGQAGPPESPT